MSSPESLHIISDVDDVQIKHIETWLNWLNGRIGTSFTETDYQEDMVAMTGHPEPFMRQVAGEFHASGVLADADPVDGAVDAIAEITERDVVSDLTSRRKESEAATHHSIRRHFGTKISRICLTGIYDNHPPSVGKTLTKTPMIRTMGGHMLIDNEKIHAFDAAANGYPAILFGTYYGPEGYNNLPEGVIHCPTWQDVTDYGLPLCKEIIPVLQAA